MTRLYRYAILIFVLMCVGCQRASKPPMMATQPHRELPPSYLNSIDAAEWVSRQNELDEAHGKISRLGFELEKEQERKDSITLHMLKQASRYSWLFIILSIGLFALSILPFTKALFSGMGSMSFVLFGLGLFFMAFPTILDLLRPSLALYGPIVFLPIGIIIVVYLAVIAYIQIRAKLIKAGIKAKVAVNALDREVPEVDTMQLIDAEAEQNPAFARAFSKEIDKLAQGKAA